jgi:hypothetical protein
VKRCPTCNRTFDEDWLAFCTDDGSTLIEMPSAPLSNEPPPTVFIPPAVDTNPGAPKPFDLPGSYNPPQPVAPAWRPPPPPPIRPARIQKQGLAVASLILGIFSMTFGLCCGLGIFTALAGVITGSVSLVQIKNDPVTNTGKPLSIIGIILSSVYLLVGIVFFMIWGFAGFLGALGQ